ncbi:UvrB/UvrC motif-containing protein [Cerasicoccus maritimus]|uniref:UvrB/UvrC motif-containing protein n=1 Tax=Cerasicoccus maritimus TaxID=490089 RepID=UPI002852B92A|nr:UvrB/UvrC motif-containing protein [Cerasicoccus maritimus]
MAKPPDCSHCQKPATIHLTQIVNNEIKKLDFCEDCPHQKGVTDPAGFSLADLLSSGDEESFSGNQSAVSECPSCGFSPKNFKKLGRLGCPDCYTSLEDFIEPMLAKMHRGTHHNGKFPHGLVSRILFQRKVRETEEALQSAVESENYEEAAKLRDELKALQSSPESTNFSHG